MFFLLLLVVNIFFGLGSSWINCCKTLKSSISWVRNVTGLQKKNSCKNLDPSKIAILRALHTPAIEVQTPPCPMILRVRRC